MFSVKSTAKDFYKASINGKKLRLQELQKENAKVQKIKREKYEN